jgi:UDP-N-acetylglucosamine 4,6-dehydratase
MIPSVRIPDLAAAMAPKLATKVIGIRPGEKVHEIMCPTDDSHLTLRFHDHFVMKPTIKFYRRDVDYLTNQLGEKGEAVPDGFEYNSGRNDHFLNVDEIREFNRIAAQ